MNIPGKSKPTIKIDPTKVYACIEGHVTAEGVFPTGTRERGEHPDVIGWPQFWADASLGDGELQALKVQRGFIHR